MSSEGSRLRAAFMGTPAFAADILEELSHHVEVVCAFTQPDRVRGRGKKLEPSPVKVKAEELGIPVLCVSSFKESGSVEELASFAPDVICVAAFGALLPKSVLDIPPLGCLNVHASILPRWRGAAPIERAILAGDAEAGVCIMRMEEGLDTGDHCIMRRIPISGMSAPQVTEELASLGASALVTALGQIRDGQAHWTKQDEDAVTYAEKIGKHELDLDPETSATECERRVRASSDAHPSKCKIGKRGVTVLGARVVDDERLASKVVPSVAASIDGHLILGCADGALEVCSLKPDGKRGMDAQEFIRGYQALEDGVSWGSA